MDLYPYPELDPAEREYAKAEREGMRLDSLLCPECPDPALCVAENECPRGAES